MSTDFSNLSSQREAMQTHYLQNSKLTSYDSSDLPGPGMMYHNPTSTLPGHGYYEGQSIERKEEVFAKRFVDEQNDDLSLQHKQGLSLSLGNQVPSSIQMASYQNAYTHSGGSLLLSSRVEHTDDHHSQSSDLEKAEDFSFDLAKQTTNRFNVGSLYVPRSSISPKAMNSHLKLQDDIVVGGMIYHSKYLKVVHELLDEFVNVHQYLKQPNKHNDCQSLYHNNVSQLKSDCQPRMLMDSQKTAPVSSNELSPTLQNDLHNRMTKLLSMLDEVDQKYQQYYMQMQCVESSFEIVAGLGAARRYTVLALRTISAHFRCLHDAIKRQIQVVQKSLGEQGTAPNLQGVGLSRLRYLDQQMRQQRNLQQFGMVRQPWRPQRGLPGTAVSILRAWLFEHFLHPYPNDSEKIMLARQTGLNRSQVANWFINARVRLWKPMIEEMYNQEFGDMGMDIRCSPESEQACGKLKDFEDTGEKLHDHLTIKVTNSGKQVTPDDLSKVVTADPEGNNYRENLIIQNDYHGEEKMVFETNQSWRDQTVNVCDQSGQNNNRSSTAVTDAFNFSMLGAAMGTQVSLALGLQHSENESRPIFGGTQPGMSDTAAASVLDTADYFCIDALNQHDRFSNSHILSDFVA